MIAGALGLLLSLAGLVMVWVAKPNLAIYANDTIDTLAESVSTSRKVMEITARALGATVESVDALATMLSTTATTVEDTTPVLDEIDTMMATTLPATLEATTDSLYAAQEAAQVLESAIQSLDTFRFLLSASPLVGNLVPQPGEPYDPEEPLADSLGTLASTLEDLPDTFVQMSLDLSGTDDNLTTVRRNLVSMSESVGLISSSLSEYEAMVVQSQSSMDDLMSILSDLKDNVGRILNWIVVALSLFLVWLLAAQVVILSQGWELYHGTADRLEGKAD